MPKRAYVGCKVGTVEYEVFMHDAEPTEASHGALYSHSVGPFNTKRDATAYVESNAQLWYRGLSTAFRADEVDMLPSIYSNVLPRCPACNADLYVRRNRRNYLVMYCKNDGCESFDRSRPVVVR